MLDSITSYINDRYGSRRGLLKHYLFGFKSQLGQFRRFKQIDWARVDRIVFVCHGNICRSPLAEAYASQHLRVAASSFGLDCRDGAPADPRAARFARSIGIDLTSHHARHIRHYEPRDTDLVVCMEPRHIERLSDLKLDLPQVTLAGLWMPSPNPYIHDPYMSDEVHFARCEQSVIDAVAGIRSLLCRPSTA